ncbi:phospholipase/carboxylesterase [Entomortierella parvispora]|uniref:Acyl-protein thioesterase 1 n=1 Tax=Entomortierella parvispora TaxID=205924 RepID=A0A9P3HLT6_9FUNG|nr:phospholipase/carboxylesterase [Entomortierella parvispora]
MAVVVLAGVLAYGYLSMDLLGLVSSLDKRHMVGRASAPPAKAPIQDPGTYNMNPSPKDISNAKFTSVVLDATTKHTATVIFLHGFGDSGAGWAPVGEQFSRYLPHVKFVFPNAPPLAITAHGGTLTPAWFDLYTPEIAYKMVFDEKRMLLSRQKVMDIINEEIEQNKIPADRIVIGGFSQGCVLGLLIGLTSEQKLAGIIGLSGHIPLPEKIMDLATEANRKTPIFYGHGDSDLVVKYEHGKQSVQLLKDNKYNVQFQTYPHLDHSANDQELRDILAFLLEVIPKVTPGMAKM